MLRLERMQIKGFKSFSDRTEVVFREGVTGIVGPNGCGKSNIGDAINWVLGEQSPRALRGKQMADVIFSGTERRKPLGMAEVSLHLAGAEGLTISDQGRVILTRRLFRDGESDYLLNGKRARLKDIQQLLFEARVGARSYATIEQGKIDQILNARPKDRRQIIEDAAGIAGYKQKKRLTELKLDATQANLLRVNDIILEVERQIRSLKRQAAKARRYRRLRDELRAHERVKFAVRADELDAELAQLRNGEARAGDAESEGAASLAKLEVAFEQAREALEQGNQEFRTASERLHELEKEIDREETQVSGCKERITELEEVSSRQATEAEQLAGRREELDRRAADQRSVVERGRAELETLRSRLAAQQGAVEEAEVEHGALRGEIEGLRRSQFEVLNRAAELRNQRRSTAEALERNRAQRTRLEAERSSSREDLTRLDDETSTLVQRETDESTRRDAARSELVSAEKRLADSRKRRSEVERQLAEARELERSAEARLGTLEDVATRFAGVSDGVRTLLSQGPGQGLQNSGVVADFIEAGKDVEAAAEGYLGAFLPTVILEEDADVEHAARLLRSAGAGRTSLISRAQPAGRPAVGNSTNGRGVLPDELRTDARVEGSLRERLKLHTAANGAIDDRVGDAILVRDLAAALQLHRQYPSVDYLTRDGDVVWASGVVSTGGRPQGDRGLLAHQRRIQEARRDRSGASKRAAESETRAGELGPEVEEIERAVERHRSEAETAERTRLELEHRIQRSTDDRDRTGRRAEVLGLELEALGQQIEEGGETLRRMQEDVDRAEKEHHGVEAALSERIRIEAERESRRRELEQHLATLRADLAALQERQEACEQEGRRLDESAAELGSRVENLLNESASAKERALATTRLQRDTERLLVEHLEERRQLQTRCAEMERSIADRQRELQERERSLRGSRERLDELREASRRLELERTKTESTRSHLDELCLQELGSTAEEARRLAREAGASLDEVDLAALEIQIEELRGLLEKIGPVNMTAIEEFAELEERLGFLSAQREDLDQSMASLRDTIRRIDRSSRDRFVSAFEAIRKSYQEIFTLLFSGGRADLRLEEGEDVLECGIEIMVQPPGKRLGSIQLMSGGEKALSAIALLFAVFRFQPSPFCLLDEVDAALDDANVGRFARMISEYARQTQFILITHNKLSMESADLLYGVTMQEPGVSTLVSMQLS